MEDKELIELASKASGKYYGPLITPLHNNALAFELMVSLRISVEFWEGYKEVWATSYESEMDSLIEPYGDDPYAATRRAIVRAAAEIGRTME